jgi:glutathione S-transferase
MAAVKIYGAIRSRAARCLWCAKELGIPVEHVDIGRDALKQPAFLAVNPNGKVPAMTDGEVTLFESLAINLYLAKKHGLGQLYPSKLEDEGRVWQWTLWTANEIEPAIGPAILWHFFQRGSQAEADEAVQKVVGVLHIPDAALAGRTWLIGDRFSVADLNLASGMRSVQAMNVDLSAVPNVKAWFERCVSRPAANIG